MRTAITRFKTGRRQNRSRNIRTWKQAAHVRSMIKRFAGGCVDSSNGEALRVVQIWQHCRCAQHLQTKAQMKGPLSAPPSRTCFLTLSACDMAGLFEGDASGQ